MDRFLGSEKAESGSPRGQTGAPRSIFPYVAAPSAREPLIDSPGRFSTYLLTTVPQYLRDRAQGDATLEAPPWIARQIEYSQSRQS